MNVGPGSRLVAGVVAFLAGGAAPAHAQDSEVVTLLQDLVRINTSNPPGNEALVAELLRSRLEPLGFQVEIVPTPAAGKAHLIARLPGHRAERREAAAAGGARGRRRRRARRCGRSTRSPA